MIISTFFNIYLMAVITGLGYAFKSFVFKGKVEVFNLDILYGFFLIIFVALVFNFFFPLKYFFFIIILIGSFFFFKGLIKKKIRVNFIYHFVIVFLLNFIVYNQGDNVDTPMYHLQIIKWLYNEKVVFGLSNFEIRFGSNSLWFNIVSILQFNYKDFNSIYTFNFLPFSILIYQSFFVEKKLSYIFLALSISFLLLFSLLHPFLNGVILNQLHNTEIDTVGMIFFILSFYLFLRFIENPNINNLRILIISSVICLTIKLSYIAVIVLPLFSAIKFYKINYLEIFKQKLNLIIIIFLSLWFIKNFIISGCILFLVNNTCFNVPWSPGLEEIETYSKVVKSFARDTRERLRYLDFQHTIDSLSWFKPWFKDYAMNNAFLKIAFFITIFSFLSIVFLNLKNLLNRSYLDNKKHYLLFILLILPNFYVWFQAPETRFGWGIIITFCCFILSIAIFHFKYFENLPYLFARFSSLLLLIFLSIDNISNFSFYNLINPYKKKINYSKIIKVGNYNNFDIYQSTNWQCYDFKKICVNKVKNNYKISRKFGYLIILN